MAKANTTEKPKDPKRCLTPKARLSFPQLWKAKSYKDKPPKFSVSLLFPKDVDLSGLRKAVYAAKVEKWGKDKDKWPKKIASPFADGDDKSDLDGYAGMIVVGATSKHRPGVVDQKKAPIAEEDGKLHAGDYVRATITANAVGGKGTDMAPRVHFWLANVQKLADGEHFGGGRSADEDFDEVEDDSDDEENYEENDGDDDEEDAGF